MKNYSRFYFVVYFLFLFLFVGCGTVNGNALTDSTVNSKNRNFSDTKNIIKKTNDSETVLSKDFSPFGYVITAEDVLDYGGELLCDLDENFSKLMELAFSEKTEKADEYYSSNNVFCSSIVNYTSKLESDSSEFNKISRLFNNFPGIRKVIFSSLNYKIGMTGPASGYVFYDCDADNVSGNADGLKSSECGWRYLEAAPEDLPGTYTFYQASAVCERYSASGYLDWFLPSGDELYLMYENLKMNGIGNFKRDYYWSSDTMSTYYGGTDPVRLDFGDGENYHYFYGPDSHYYVRPIRAF